MHEDDGTEVLDMDAPSVNSRPMTPPYFLTFWLQFQHVFLRCVMHLNTKSNESKRKIKIHNSSTYTNNSHHWTQSDIGDTLRFTGWACAVPEPSRGLHTSAKIDHPEPRGAALIYMIYNLEFWMREEVVHETHDATQNVSLIQPRRDSSTASLHATENSVLRNLKPFFFCRIPLSQIHRK